MKKFFVMFTAMIAFLTVLEAGVVAAQTAPENAMESMVLGNEEMDAMMEMGNSLNELMEDETLSDMANEMGNMAVPETGNTY